MRPNKPVTKDDERVLKEHDDVAMMSRPHLWLRWPWLPLKRPVANGVTLQDCEFGIIHADDTEPGRTFSVFRTNVFFRHDQRYPTDGTPRETFENAQAAFDAGWHVD